MGEEMQKPTVVLYTAVGAGHVIPMVEFAKLLLPHGLSLTVVIPDGAVFNIASVSSYISSVSSAHPSITFHHLPSPTTLAASGDPLADMFNLLRLYNPLLLSFLRTLPARTLILDFFCTDALDVSADLSVPSYIFFCSAASTLAAFLRLPDLLGDVLDDAPLSFPGLPPIPASYLPDVLLDPEREARNQMLFHFKRLPLADGIIVNTFRSLEERAVAAVAAGLCVPAPPPVFCVGPVIAKSTERHECLSWLDTQPMKSVVFLCFGSMVGLSTLPEEQLREIAVGLDRSGQRFLWAVRISSAEMEAILPQGFVSRTAERGLVVTTWAPQVAVLMHEAVGGFVTHCGWNSILEAVAGGVPMIAWPLYAEQWMNKVYLTEVMGVAVEMGMGEGGWVAAEEVEERVRWLMEAEGGGRIRVRAAEVKKAAAAAMAEAGESQVALVEFVEKVKRGR